MVTQIDKCVRHVLLLVSFVAMLAVSLAAGCHSFFPSNDLSSVSVTLKRTACYGWCPVYSVAIHGNGLVEYLGEVRVDVPGPQTARIPRERVKDLLRSFEEIRFFDLKEKYFEACTDMPTAIISISVDGRSKEISNYYGGCEGAKTGPQVDLAKLAQKIDETAGTDRWIKCDFDCMKGLVQTGLNVNAQSPHGDTPLLIAIQERDLKKVQLLLDADAQVNTADAQGYTPLMWAAIEDDLEIVQELLARGADVKAKDKKGFTVLDMAGGKKVRQVLARAKSR